MVNPWDQLRESGNVFTLQQEVEDGRLQLYKFGEAITDGWLQMFKYETSNYKTGSVSELHRVLSSDGGHRCHINIHFKAQKAEEEKRQLQP